VRVRGVQEQFATCHGRYDERDLRGELILRSADGALISLDVSGRDDIVEDVCGDDRRTRRRVGQYVADTEFHLSAPCFATGG
jgi:hypothetical protein